MKHFSATSHLFALLLVATFFRTVTVAATEVNNLVTDSGPGTPTTSSGDMTLGYDFLTHSGAILVTALGIWDQGQDGLANAHTIGLWINGGTQGSQLAASVTVPAGTAAPLSGQFRFVNLATPIVISGNFVIGASYLINDDDAYISNRGGQQPTWDSAIVGIGRPASSAATTGFTYPNNFDAPGSNVGPNLQFSIVPESSSSLLLLAIGCLVVIVLSITTKTVSR